MGYFTNPLPASWHIRPSESLHVSRLTATVFTTPTIAIGPILPFPFQPFTSRWLIFLSFFFLLVPKSLLCSSRCFDLVLVHVHAIMFNLRSSALLFTRSFHASAFLAYSMLLEYYSFSLILC